MLIKTKINAFTLVEVTVTMVISSIVVAAAIYVFFTFNRMLFYSEKKNLNNMEIIQLQQILKKDFIEADEIYFQYESIIVKYFS